MQRWAVILAIFFLGAGTALLFNSYILSTKFPVSTKPVEITQEAASTSALISSNNSTSGEIATVKRVVDGDTIELSDDRRVRYIGIDTPEIVDPRKPIECFGREASDENKKLVEGKTIRLEKDISETDKYKRLLRYIFIGDIFVNDYLVRQGFAHASTFPPDVKYNEKFRQAEAEARENNRGLWAGCVNPTNQTNNTNPTNGINPSGQCVIKGNISTTGDKIYHLPGCGSYDKVVIDESKGERWFCTEEDAVAAGWRKAKNC